jgi:hypothetical protein
MDTMDGTEWKYSFIQAYLFALLFIPELNRKQNEESGLFIQER